jgi:hypothetical protein
MTDRPLPVIESTAREIVSRLRANEEAQQMARVAAASWSSTQEPQGLGNLRAAVGAFLRDAVGGQFQAGHASLVETCDLGGWRTPRPRSCVNRAAYG